MHFLWKLPVANLELLQKKSLNYKVEAGSMNKEIEVPTSKSFANRLLILAAISKSEITLNNLPLSSDVEIMIECLKKLGLQIIETKNYY